MLTYGGKSGKTLDHLRYRKFCEKIATCNVHVHPKALPPTSSAAVQHNYRVYCQVNEWKGNVTEPTEWGWELQGANWSLSHHLNNLTLKNSSRYSDVDVKKTVPIKTERVEHTI